MKEKTAPLTAAFESCFTRNSRLTLSEISAPKPQNSEASAATSFFGKQRSKVIVRVTRKCLSDIFSFPEHLAPAEGIDPENPLPMVANFEVDLQAYTSSPGGRFRYGLPITFNA